MRVLFISYYFLPYEGVGATRVSYWANNISKIDASIECDVITAIKQKKTFKNITYVDNNCSSILLNFIKDKGVTWCKCLKNYLRQIDLDKYDIVLISGGPFMHFSVAKYLKKNSNVKVVLDFRDPFYANPRFKSSFMKDSIKRYFQNRFLKYADLVITVNKYCANLIDFKHVKIIDNGFNDNVLINKSSCKLDNKNVNLIAIGKIYDDVGLHNFFEVLKENSKLTFNYIGNHIFNPYEKEWVNNFGVKSYEETLSCVNHADIAILFTGGKEFESTTKIFDYLALNKKILIITEGRVKRGALHDITREYPNIYWCINNKSEIYLGIDTLINSKLIMFDSKRYSRKKGLEKLVYEFKQLL